MVLSQARLWNQPPGPVAVMRTTFAIFVLLAACTNSDAGDATLSPALFGRWAVGSRSGDWNPCASQIEFFEDGTYVSEFACPLNEDSFGVETSTGKWHTRGGTVTLEPAESSCPAKRLAPTTLDVLHLGSGQVALASEFAGTTIDPIEEGVTPREFLSGTRRDGCFDPDMNFSEHPIAPLEH